MKEVCQSYRRLVGAVFPVALMLPLCAQGAVWFEDGGEWNSLKEAVSIGPWSYYQQSGGTVQLTTERAHSGQRAFEVAYPGNETQAFIAIDLPGAKPGANTGKTHVFLRWWELRAHDYDWGGEKFNRIMGVQSNGNLTLDYPLGWSSNVGWGKAGTNDGGPIKFFGNSAYSNSVSHWGYNYNMPREEWHMFELEVKLNDVGKANGESRFWIDDELVVEKTGLVLRYAPYTIDRIWMGGWYSNQGVDPDPSPARRYFDDVVVSDSKIGYGNIGPKPNPPTNVIVR